MTCKHCNAPIYQRPAGGYSHNVTYDVLLAYSRHHGVSPMHAPEPADA